MGGLGRFYLSTNKDCVRGVKGERGGGGGGSIDPWITRQEDPESGGEIQIIILTPLVYKLEDEGEEKVFVQREHVKCVCMSVRVRVWGC